MVALATGPAAAWACNNTTIEATAAAGPGDTVHWTIGDAQLGAEYQVTVAGRVVQPRTTITEPVPRGSFVMPDFGSEPRSIEVRLDVSHDHEGGPWGPTDMVEYRPPSPPPADTPAPAEPGNPGVAPTPPSRRTDSGEPPPGRRQADRPNREGSRAPSAEPTPAVPVGEPAESAAPVATTTPAAANEPVTDTAEPAVEAAEAAATRRVREPARAPEIASPVPERTTPGPAFATPAPIAMPAERPGSGSVLVALAVLGLSGVCALVLVFLRRRGDAAGHPVPASRPPIPPDVLIEAELQEILAEERVRELDRAR